ncbi:ATP-dependent zinc metalloprotease YME1L isoform X1 [Microplitis demolitor]|uniref:ATP-dependent zinc metalloprotease YME1L isoform X1 n=2 Tax=Microplitis demolitor TaxID=69319 RepID=UPI0004CCB110|nr:ATP-dependent zinc metalloprotease YME1L isoform X1 [Microplitis demolitor]
MISLQSHNQVLYHLTQLLSTCTPKSSNYSRINKQHVDISINSDHFCQESLNEASKNLNALLWENMDPNKLLKLQPSQRFKKSQLKKIIRKLNNNLNKIDRGISARSINDMNWKVSYVSGFNFNDNKRGFIFNSSPCIYSGDKGGAQLLYYLSAIPGQTISTRGFKTNRNVTAEKERNPTLTSRFKAWIGLSKLGEEKPKVSIDRADLELLKNILSNKELSSSDRQRIKVAFAEGYIAGNDRKSPARSWKWLKIVQQVLMFATVFLIFLSFAGVYKKSGGSGSMFRISLGSHTAIDPEEINITFDDVKGVTEAKQELKDVVEFLKNPDKFSALGGRLPKGVLLVGPPGTGKTLLARAVAGEAHVPFFHAAGPEFDEILVGQGARRVRDLFKAAKERAPCVVFIDEIDSVGGKRTTSVIHPYANQTINQLLSEMDGFHQNEGVIVLGATNRRDDLDQALRRPGRFDVEVYVHKPDLKDRKEIIELYLTKILTKSLDVDALARATTGFTGADIETMINQAALRAAIEGADYVTMDHLEKAREKVILGPELKGRMPDKEENRITAYHEAGHALVSYYSKEAHPLAKVTIIPRAGSLGHTSYLPKKDIYHETKSQLLASMDTMLGGRAAEELIFGPDKVTTGASSDLQKATEVAEAMVKNYGMSEKVGFRSEIKNSRQENTSDYSPNTTEIIDSEVKRLLQESYERAKSILKTHAKEHKLLAEALLKYETLDAEEVQALLNDKKVESIGDKRTPIIDVPTNVM